MHEALDDLGVDIYWDAGVDTVESSPDGVHVTTEDGREWETPYLIGADGGGSQVRKEIGAEFEGDQSENSFIIADVETLDGNTIEEEPLPFERLFHYDDPAAGGRNVMLVRSPAGGGSTSSVSATTTPRKSRARRRWRSSSGILWARSTPTTSSGPRRTSSSR
jgi:3-(3-hydroxy-phenyl)propionate hydroxylase